MLNGKFYAGLPPQMSERNAPTTVKNRLQSHLFWPDDSCKDSPIDRRVKRRESLQLESRPTTFLNRCASVDETDVNTRQMFQNEFSKSSIQFNDNLSAPQQAKRQTTLARSTKRDIAAKPNAMTLEMPENIVNEAYTSAKRKQAYTSKIEFYDYMNQDDELNKRNNIRKPKIDLNDKKTVERNSKNSPKLQVKRNVAKLNAEEELISNEISRSDDFTDKHKGNTLKQKRLPRQMEYYEEQTTMPQSNRFIDNRRYNGMKPINPIKPVVQNVSNRRHYNDPQQFYDVEQIDQDIRNLRMRDAPQKHVTYQDEVYDYGNDLYNDKYDTYASRSIANRTRNLRSNITPTMPLIKTRTNMPYMKAGNYQANQYHNYGNNIISTVTEQFADGLEYDDAYQHDERSMQKPFNNAPYMMKHNNSTRKSANKMNEDIQNLNRNETTTQSSDEQANVGDGKKHLRSSICFNNGEIVADNNSVNASSSSKQPARRNARTLAANQRINVGLPN